MSLTIDAYCLELFSIYIRDQGLEFQNKQGMGSYEVNTPALDEVLMINYTSQPITVRNATSNGYFVHSGPGPYFPRWQSSPVLLKDRVNENTDYHRTKYVEQVERQGKVVLSGFEYGREGTIRDENATIARWATLRSITVGYEEIYSGSAALSMFLPVYETFEDSAKVVAVVETFLNFRRLLLNVLPNNIRGITVVVENSCEGNFTYIVDGASGGDIGVGDLHETAFDKYKQTTYLKEAATVNDGTPNGETISADPCYYQFHVFPSQVRSRYFNELCFFL